MKTLGLIGGTSWVSTIDYYRYINEGVNQRLGGLEFARCLIWSMNFGDIQRNNETNNWNATLDLFTEAAQHLEKSGVKGLLICANTMHKVAVPLQQRIQIPILHIGTVTAAAAKSMGLTQLALLGTRYTMEQDFISEKFTETGIKIMIPEEKDRIFIGNSIATELGKNIFKDETRAEYLRIIQDLIKQGAEGIVLGCTEIPLLIHQQDVSVPLLDTARIHANAGVNFMLS
jgi:aspartate racemase